MKGRLGHKKLGVLDEMFAGSLGRGEILDKYGVTKSDYEKWLQDVRFSSAIQTHIEAEYLASAVLLARYAPLAAARLIALTESDKPETARRACLDIIELGSGQRKTTDDGRGTSDENAPAMSDEQACRILAALAEGNNVEK